ncbi:MAG: rRNA maturation RNase YbeY [Waddliaceae bacterium]
MDVCIQNKQTDLSINLSKIPSIVEQVITFERQKCDEVEIHFVDKNTIASLHDQYFNDPTPTDCISFPLDGEECSHYRHMGIVVVCPQVAVEYAKDQSLDPQRETILYLVHGLLHLIGYDDQSDKDRMIMRQSEKMNMEMLEEKKLL